MLNESSLSLNVSLLKRPVFLSTLPVSWFASLPKSYLFAEIARLDRLLEVYPQVIALQSDMTMVTSLHYCESQCLTRYNELRQLVSNWISQDS
jgi:hypothetical protein